jgi:hypothetical protein
MNRKLSLIVKSLIIKSFAVLMIIGTMDSAVFSQTRIRFARGRTSATVSASGRVWVDIGGNDVGRGTTIQLRSTDDYIITVHNEMGSSTRYSLYVSIR